jgi:hypothetical protein
MTMTSKKSDRRNGNDKTPQPSPNRRALKQPRSTDTNEKRNMKDTELTIPDDNDPPTTRNIAKDLLKNFEKATKPEWKRWITLDEVQGWEILTVPGPTEIWAALSDNKQKETHGLNESDLLVAKWPLVIKDGWKDINTLYRVEKNLPFGDQLSKSLINDKDTMFEKRHARAFKCMIALSKTNFKMIPGVKEHNGKPFFTSSVISESWIASINMFGHKEEPTQNIMFSEADDIATTTKAWEESNTKEVIGFTKATLFTEDDDGAHDLCRFVKNRFLQQGHSPAQWKQLFESILAKQSDLDPSEKKAIKLAKKMAKTDPKTLDGWKGEVLYENDISSAWRGA